MTGKMTTQHRLLRRTCTRRGIKFIALVMASVLCLSWAPPLLAQARLHVIAVGDTAKRADGDDAKDIGPDMKFNLGSLSIWLRTNSPTRLLNLQVLDDNDYAREPLMRAIDSLQVGPQDAVMFFYCGHGYYDQTGRLEQGRIGTLLRPAADNYRNLWLSEIRGKIRTKQARFFVSIVDCCSVQPSKHLGVAAPAQPQSPVNFTPLFNSLFFHPTGEIAINSSAPGEYAVSSWQGKGTGSLFTQTFLKGLRDTDKTTDWSRTMQRVRSDVQAEFDLLKAALPRDSRLLGAGLLRSQQGQTVWAIKDDQIWYKY